MPENTIAEIPPLSKAIKKPKLSFWQIWNMSFGFLGIQFGFALQTGNASRILQTFGADVDQLSLFWLAAPITGMIIQPIIGHYSDRTWTKLGRRRPYFLGGAVIAALALILMPNASYFTFLLPPVLIGAGILMLMDASFNVAMEPFRALVADKLPDSQHSLGFSIQTCLIGIGAVVGSLLPYLFANYLGIAKTAPRGEIPDNVLYSFYVGAVLMLGTLLWTVFTTKEYSSEEMTVFDPQKSVDTPKLGLSSIFLDFTHMPKTMVQLGFVQFFSWFALFSMWVFMTPAVAQHTYGLSPGDTVSVEYAEAGNWVGALFGIYNAVSIVYALCLPTLARLTNRKITHSISLFAGAIGLVSIYFISDPDMLVFSMIGIGMAWGSILAMPYAMLSSTVPARKMGVYMGIFNFFITLPQIVSGILSGFLLSTFFNGEAVYTLVLAGCFMLMGAVWVLFIRDDYREK